MELLRHGVFTPEQLQVMTELIRRYFNPNTRNGLNATNLRKLFLRQFKHWFILPLIDNVIVTSGYPSIVGNGDEAIWRAVGDKHLIVTTRQYPLLKYLMLCIVVSIYLAFKNWSESDNRKDNTNNPIG